MLAFDGDIMEYDCDIHGILTEYWVKLSRVIHVAKSWRIPHFYAGSAGKFIDNN